MKKAIVIVLTFLCVLMASCFYPKLKVSLFLHNFNEIFNSCVFEISYIFKENEQIDVSVSKKIANVICDDINTGKFRGKKKGNCIKFEYYTSENVPVLCGYTNGRDVVIDVCSIYQYICNYVSIFGKKLNFLPDKEGEYYISYSDICDDVLPGINLFEKIEGVNWVMVMNRCDAPVSELLSDKSKEFYFLEGKSGDITYILGIPKQYKQNFCYLKMVEKAGEIELIIECKADDIQIEMPESNLSEIQRQLIRTMWKYYIKTKGEHNGSA